MWTGEAVPQGLSKIKVMLCNMLIFNVSSMSEKCSLRDRNLTNLEKIEQMNSFAVFKSRTNYTNSLSIDNCDVHQMGNLIDR